MLAYRVLLGVVYPRWKFRGSKTLLFVGVLMSRCRRRTFCDLIADKMGIITHIQNFLKCYSLLVWDYKVKYKFVDVFLVIVWKPKHTFTSASHVYTYLCAGTRARVCIAIRMNDIECSRVALCTFFFKRTKAEICKSFITHGKFIREKMDVYWQRGNHPSSVVPITLQAHNQHNTFSDALLNTSSRESK